MEILLEKYNWKSLFDLLWQKSKVRTELYFDFMFFFDSFIRTTASLSIVGEGERVRRSLGRIDSSSDLLGFTRSAHVDD